MSKGKLFVISGASGVGKGTVLSQVMAKRADLSFSVSATTRAPRPNEVEGVHYYFVTQEKFQQMVATNEVLEYDMHMDKCYGTPTAQLEDKLTRGHVILDVEPVGAFNIRKQRPDAVLIFIAPPSMQELERRLRNRGDTKEEQIKLRLERAVWEMEQIPKYDHVVINDRVEACADEILNIIALHSEQ